MKIFKKIYYNKYKIQNNNIFNYLIFGQENQLIFKKDVQKKYGIN